MKVVITEFGWNLYLVKVKGTRTVEEVKMLPEIKNLAKGREVEVHPHDHGIWIVHIH